MGVNPLVIPSFSTLMSASTLTSLRGGACRKGSYSEDVADICGGDFARQHRGIDQPVIGQRKIELKSASRMVR